MALNPIGSAAGEATAPQRNDVSDRLLDAIRRNLLPGDPVARLLAAWPLVPGPSIGTTRHGSGAQNPG